MNPVRQLCRSAALVAGFAASILVVAEIDGLGNPKIARADDLEEQPAKAQETDPDYMVPEGTPEEIMSFLDKLKSRKTKFANRREEIDHAIKLYRAFIDAGDKILAQDTTAKVAANAARMKLNALMVLATNEIGDSAKEAMVAVTKLKADERDLVAKVAEKYWMPIRIVNVGNLDDADRKELADQILSSVSDSQFSAETVGAATELGDALAAKGLAEEGARIFDRLARLATLATDPEIQASAKQFEGVGRRIRLPGHPMTIEGTRLDGEDFDWESYRGKVVLVDFWATWCGPCIEELPNVKKNYKKYHDKGFEVVAISLDRSRESLERFIEKKQIPWVQLYDEERQKGRGWNHPMAEHFGISAIPAAFLVDQEGNVVSLRARGEELTKLLEKLLGNKD